jgi:hypothetical protein
MTGTVIPRWELHIQPMFCLLDRYHMLGYNINFNDVQSVWSHRQPILSHVQGGSMPPPHENGPWPKEMVDLFARWVTAGETQFGGNPPALSLADGSDYRLTLQFGTLQILGKASLPYQRSKAWFQIVSYNQEAATLNLYLEDPPNPSPDQTSAGVELSLDMGKIGTTPDKVIVIDATGSHPLPVSSSMV